MPALDSLNCCRTLQVGEQTYHYYSLPEAARGLGDITRLPLSLKVLLENLLRWEDGLTVRRDDCQALADWLRDRCSEHEIQYRPARVLMQDFTGVPAVVDLAAMRDAAARVGGDPARINPGIPVDLVIDHSVMVDRFADPSADRKSTRLNSSHVKISYAVFCLKKKTEHPEHQPRLLKP